MRILVTGAAGFIGSRLSMKLALNGCDVMGVDHLGNYSEVKLKYDRLCNNGFVEAKEDIPYNQILVSHSTANLRFVRLSINDKQALTSVLESEQYDVIVHLAAQAGVRYSMINPSVYVETNISGFLNVLELCHANAVKKIVYASSSSVYGTCANFPYSENDSTGVPISFYAITKKTNEMMAYSYSRLYNIPMIGLRYFTVYGPWGRPDMLPMLLADSIRDGKQIEIYNNGKMYRDFTYIDDVVDATIRAIKCDCGVDVDGVPHHIYNVASSKPILISDFIRVIEDSFQKKAKQSYVSQNALDVSITHADITKITNELGYNPKYSIEQGVDNFITWYKKYNNLSDI